MQLLTYAINSLISSHGFGVWGLGFLCLLERSRWKRVMQQPALLVKFKWLRIWGQVHQSKIYKFLHLVVECIHGLSCNSGNFIGTAGYIR